MSSYSTDSAADDRRVIVVCGASGVQGSSVAGHLLRQQEFAVKALTRNPESEVIQGTAHVCHLQRIPMWNEA